MEGDATMTDLPTTPGLYSASDLSSDEEYEQQLAKRNEYLSQFYESVQRSKEQGYKPRDTSGFELNLPWVVDTPSGMKLFKTEQEALDYTAKYIEDLQNIANEVIPGIFGLMGLFAGYWATTHPEQAKQSFEALRHLTEPIINGLTDTIKGIGQVIPG